MKVLLLFTALIVNPIDYQAFESFSNSPETNLVDKGRKNKSGRYKKKKGLFKRKNGCDCPKH
jgi:hypothetical protein